SIQQNVLGILGVNLVYAAYYYNHDVQLLVESLADNLSFGSVEIDMISLRGPAFKHTNDRLVNLYLIEKGFSSAAIFDPNGNVTQAKDLLYKKDIMILRTKYLQKSIPNFDLFNRAVEQFKASENVDDRNLVVLIEVLMSNPLQDENAERQEGLEVFARRAEELCATGNNVI